MGHPRWALMVLSLCLLLWPRGGDATLLEGRAPPQVKGQRVFYVVTTDHPFFVQRRGIGATTIPNWFLLYETIPRREQYIESIVAHQSPIDAVQSFQRLDPNSRHRAYTSGRSEPCWIYQFLPGPDVLQLPRMSGPGILYSISAGWRPRHLVSFAMLPPLLQLRELPDIVGLVHYLRWQRADARVSMCRHIREPGPPRLAKGRGAVLTTACRRPSGYSGPVSNHCRRGASYDRWESVRGQQPVQRNAERRHLLGTH